MEDQCQCLGPGAPRHEHLGIMQIQSWNAAIARLFVQYVFWSQGHHWQ